MRELLIVLTVAFFLDAVAMFGFYLWIRFKVSDLETRIENFFNRKCLTSKNEQDKLNK